MQINAIDSVQLQSLPMKHITNVLGSRELTPMERKLTRGDVRFTKSYWGDFLFYIKNTHIIFSICCGHRDNPYGGAPRFIAVLSSNFYALFLAICLTYEKDSRTAFIMEYTLIVVLQSLYDLEVQYLTSCACVHRDVSVGIWRCCSLCSTSKSIHHL